MILWTLMIWACTLEGCVQASPIENMTAESCIATRRAFLRITAPERGDTSWSEARCAPQSAVPP